MAETPDDFRLLGEIRNIQSIAAGKSVKIRHWPAERYGGRSWRKMKGIAFIERDNGYIGDAEIRWFEAHGVAKVEWKVKRQFTG